MLQKYLHLEAVQRIGKSKIKHIYAWTIVYYLACCAIIILKTLAIDPFSTLAKLSSFDELSCHMDCLSTVYKKGTFPILVDLICNPANMVKHLFVVAAFI